MNLRRGCRGREPVRADGFAEDHGRAEHPTTGLTAGSVRGPHGPECGPVRERAANEGKQAALSGFRRDLSPPEGVAGLGAPAGRQ
jgi:hypothetical protein